MGKMERGNKATVPDSTLRGSFDGLDTLVGGQPKDPLSMLLEEQQEIEERTIENSRLEPLDFFDKGILEPTVQLSIDKNGEKLNSNEFENLLKDSLKQRGWPKETIHFAVNSCIHPYRSRFSSLLQEKKSIPKTDATKNAEIDARIKEQMVERDNVVRSLITKPQDYSILPEFFGKQRKELVLESKELHERLSHIEIDENTDSEYINYVFKINGNEMTLTNIRTVVTALFNETFTAQSDVWKKTIIEECIEPVLEKIWSTIPFRTDQEEVKVEKDVQRTAVLQSLAFFLHDVIIAGKVNGYAELIVQGTTNEDISVDYPLLSLRLPLKIRSEIVQARKSNNKAEVNKITRKWYNQKVAGYTAEEIANLGSMYEEGLEEALVDKAGRKPMILFTEEINALLKSADFNDVQIENAYSARIGSILTSMIGSYEPLSKLRAELRNMQKNEEIDEAQRARLEDNIRTSEAAQEKIDRELISAVRERIQFPYTLMMKDEVGSVSQTFQIANLDTSRE